jgi:hypothetical protein
VLWANSFTESFVERISLAVAVFGIKLPKRRSRLGRSLLACLSVLAALLQPGLSSAAGSLDSAAASLSDPTPSSTSNYSFTGSSVDTSQAILCVKVIWATTAAGDAAPTGFDGSTGTVDAADSTLIGSSATNWSLARADGTGSSGQKNIFEYTNSASGYTPVSASGQTFVLGGIVNSSNPGAGFYFKIATFGNTNCTSSPIDNATVGYINTSGQTLSLNVDQSLSFTVNPVVSGASCDGGTTTAGSTSTAVPFGSVSSAANSLVCQDLQAASNATNGYSVYLRYTGPPTNAGSDTIADWSGTNDVPTNWASSGVEGYGYTTDDSTLSTCSGSCAANRFTDGSTYHYFAKATASNAEVGYEPAGGTLKHYHIGHQVGVSTTTNPGVYTTTIIYTCTPVY